MTETYSFLRLRELIDAKIERRVSLLAEIAAIDEELADAHRLLGDVPSLQRGAMPEPTAAVAFMSVSEVPPPKKKYVYPKKLVVKPCERCRLDFEGHAKRRFCKACFSAQASERFAELWRTGRVRVPRQLVEEIDMRIAVGGNGYGGATSSKA